MAKKRAEIEARLGRRPESAEQAAIDRFMTSSTGDVQASNLDLRAIRLDRIVPDPNQPRRTMSEESLAELAASIREQGVIQPIEVDHDPGQDVYVLVHGERRWKAARMAGLSTIPAIIKPSPLDRATRLVRQLIENIQREDLNDVDRARALVSLRDQMQEERDARLAADELGDSTKATWKTRVTWAEVGERVGLSRARMSQLRALLDLPDAIRDDVRQGVLTEYDTRVYRGLATDQQQELHRAWREQGLTSTDVREAATILKAEAKAPDPRSVEQVVALVTAPPPPRPTTVGSVEGLPPPPPEHREEAIRPAPAVEKGPAAEVQAPARWLANLGHLHATLSEISSADQLTDEVIAVLVKIQSLIQDILARSNPED